MDKLFAKVQIHYIAGTGQTIIWQKKKLKSSKQKNMNLHTQLNPLNSLPLEQKSDARLWRQTEHVIQAIKIF